MNKSKSKKEGGSGDILQGVYAANAWSFTNLTQGSSRSGASWSSLATNAAGTYLVAAANPGDVWTYSANPTTLAGGPASSVHLVYVGGGAFSVEDINGAVSLQ